MTQSNLDVVFPLGSAAIPASGRRKGALVAGLLVVAALGAVSFTAHRQIDLLLSSLDEEVLTQATRTLGSLVERQKDQLAAEVRVLADDNRIRSTVLAPQFDRATVQDVIEDLRKSSGATLLAVLDAGGKVQVVTGSGALREANLSASPTVKAAFTKASSDVWTLSDQVQVIGIAAIRSGPQVPALLVKGLPLGEGQLTTVATALGVAGAILVGDKVVAISAHSSELAEALRLGIGLSDGSSQVSTARGTYLVRVSRTGSAATAARVVWAVTHHHQAAKTQLLGLLVFAPLVLGGLLFLLLIATSIRTNGGSS